MKLKLALCMLVWLGWTVPCFAEGTVKIAAVFPMTGEAVYTEPVELKGVRFAVQVLNERGGLLGKRIELLEFDDHSRALGAKQAGEQAVKAGVLAVIGSTWSSLSLGLAPVLQEARIPMITPVSTNPKVTQVGDYIFRACFSDPFQGTVMANFAYHDLKARRAVVLTNASEVYSEDLGKFFTDSFAQKGGKVLWEGKYLTSTTDFKPQIEKIKDYNPDVIFVPGGLRDSGYIIKQARVMGVKAHFLGGDGWSINIYQFAGKAADGGYYCAHWHMKSTNKQSQQFVKAYESKYGVLKEDALPLGYDAVMLLADAVKRANSLEPAKIRDALAATKGFKGVTGTITMNKDRDPIKSAVILKLQDGASNYFKTIEPE